MIKRLSVLLFAVLLFSVYVNAQQTYMRPDGKFYKSDKIPTSFEVMKMKHARPEKNNSITSGPLAGVNGLLDTLRYPQTSPGSNFGLNGQDIFLQWFKAPAELIIKGFAYYATENLGGVVAEGKIVSVNLTEEQLMAQPVHQYGYYEATGNGYNNITGFLDNPDRTGAWTSIVSGEPEPFGSDIWSDGGFGAPTTPDPTLSDYQWTNTDILFEPTIPAGDVFGIVIKSTHSDMTVRSMGCFASTYTGVAPGWKYYANGRLVTGVDYGWWVREYVWDFLVAVDIIGDPGPDINTVTEIPSGMNVGPFTVDANITDTNPGNPGQAGVASATLYYSVDDGTTWTSVPMTGTEPNYTAQIPAQTAGTTVIYYVEATDLGAHTTVGSNNSFYIFAPTPGVNTLVVLNGYNTTDGYPIDYFFGEKIAGSTADFDHDVWAYGAVTEELLNNYSNIFEICNGAPAVYTDSVVALWLAGGSSRNYYLEGQEWLGSRYSFTDMDFTAGDFEFDVLGVNHVYNDVSYANSVGQLLPSKLMPQAGTLFGQPLLDKFATYSPVPDSIQYNPVYEGLTGDQNWIDAFTVESDVVVDVLNETRGFANVTHVENLPCAVHRTLPAGNKIFFASYWTYAVNTATRSSLPTYHWLGVADESPAYQALLWFNVPITDVELVDNNVPKQFSLGQNYPNPFNPTTKISFSLPEASNVVLKIFDVLGSEVATLFEGEKPAGNYEVNFDASKLASGMYVYTINAGNFTSTKKMMLMK